MHIFIFFFNQYLLRIVQCAWNAHWSFNNVDIKTTNIWFFSQTIQRALSVCTHSGDPTGSWQYSADWQAQYSPSKDKSITLIMNYKSHRLLLPYIHTATCAEIKLYFSKQRLNVTLNLFSRSRGSSLTAMCGRIGFKAAVSVFGGNSEAKLLYTLMK